MYWVKANQSQHGRKLQLTHVKNVRGCGCRNATSLQPRLGFRLRGELSKHRMPETIVSRRGMQIAGLPSERLSAVSAS